MNLPMVFIKTYSCFKLIDNGSQEVNGNTLLPNKTLYLLISILILKPIL